MLEFDWLECFIHHVMEKKIQETRPPPLTLLLTVNYCLELNCCIKYMIFNLFITILYEKYFVYVHNVN